MPKRDAVKVNTAYDRSMESLSIFSSNVYRRIQEARTSSVRVACVDLFVGPVFGRRTSMKKLTTLAQEIGSSLEYHLSEPLLILNGTGSVLYGKLVVVGGGHRFLVGARQKHMLLIPYQVVDLSNLNDDGSPVDFLRHDFLLIHHIESSEPRPAVYGIMAQVAEYEKLRNYWKMKENERVRKLNHPSATPLSPTHPKIIDLYKVLYKPSRNRSTHAIAFMDPSLTMKTLHGYLSGADRLLKANVVGDLCFLEGFANTSFNIRSLETVRTWKISKIKATLTTGSISLRRNQIRC
eukprot:gb/GEZJ01007993.1/.p1 GENE.gb/GEZJ01007993.1/~~gb/GEZJ01007993.1/.p1  ORF type:complete len:326 (-),score=27.70 gb/GEZJ01007993.1/:3-881(-)